MAFIHGKNAAVLVGSGDLTSFLNEAQVSRGQDMAETSAFGSSAKTYIVGMQDGTFNASGMFDGDEAAIDARLAALIGVEAASVVTFAPEGLAVGKRGLSCAARQTSYEVSAPVSEVVAVSVDVQAEGGVDSGWVLAAGAEVSTSGNGASVDGLASSSNGGAAYLHVTANDRNGTAVFKVQHSVDGVTFADLGTFTTVTASTETAERILVAGTVNRYLRANHAPGGATGSVTYSMTFARR